MAQLTRVRTSEQSARRSIAVASSVWVSCRRDRCGVAVDRARPPPAHHRSDDALVCFAAGYFVFGAVTGVARRHLSATAILVGAAVASALGLIVIAASPSWPAFLVGAAVLGCGGGALDTGLNVSAALHVSARTMNVLHACFAGGATLGPLLLAAVLAIGGSWRVAYVILFACTAAMTVAFVRRGALFATVAPSDDDVVEAPTVGSMGRSTVVVALIAAVAIVYVGSEVSAGQWGPSLIRERGSSPATAGLWIAGFWAGLGGGRLIAAYVAGWLSAARLLAASLVVVVTGAFLLWSKPTLVGGNLGFVVLGGHVGGVPDRRVPHTELGWHWPAPIAIGMQIAGSARRARLPVGDRSAGPTPGLEVVGPDRDGRGRSSC
jgi:MFS family permease